MNFAEFVAILSGNTDLLNKAKLDNRIMQLEKERAQCGLQRHFLLESDRHDQRHEDRIDEQQGRCDAGIHVVIALEQGCLLYTSKHFRFHFTQFFRKRIFDQTIDFPFKMTPPLLLCH